MNDYAGQDPNYRQPAGVDTGYGLPMSPDDARELDARIARSMAATNASQATREHADATLRAAILAWHDAYAGMSPAATAYAFRRVCETRPASYSDRIDASHRAAGRATLWDDGDDDYAGHVTPADRQRYARMLASGQDVSRF